MKLSLRGLLLALLTLIAGCFGTIYSEQPLGERVAVLSPNEWNGVWLGSGGELTGLLVTDADKGMMVGSADHPCEPASGAKPEQLRQSESWFFNVEKSGDLYSTSSALFRVNQALLVYFVDKERVKELVEQRTLPGRIDNNRVILGALGPEHYQVLLSREQPAFERQPAGVMVKLPEKLDPCLKAGPPK